MNDTMSLLRATIGEFREFSSTAVVVFVEVLVDRS